MDGTMKRRLLGAPARRSSMESPSAHGTVRTMPTGAAARARQQARSEVRRETVAVSASHSVKRGDLRDESALLDRPQDQVGDGGDAQCGDADDGSDATEDARQIEEDMEAPGLNAFAFSPRYIEEAQLQELRERPPVSFVVHNAAGNAAKRATKDEATVLRAAEGAARDPGRRQSWNSPVHVPLTHRKLVQAPSIFSNDPPFRPIAPRPPPSLGVTQRPQVPYANTGKANAFRGARTLEKLEPRPPKQTDFRDQMGNGAFMQALRERNRALFGRLVLRFERLKRIHMQFDTAVEEVGNDIYKTPMGSVVTSNNTEGPVTSEFSGVEDAILFFLEAKHKHDVLYFRRKGGSRINQEVASTGATARLSLGLSSAPASATRYMPYDLERLDESPRLGKGDYFIMTQASIVHHSNNTDESDLAGEVIPVSQWILESKMFSLLLAGIPLFQKFLVRKVFMGWVSAIRQFMYRDNRKIIAQNLPLARPAFVQPMLQSYHALRDIQSIRSLMLPRVRPAVDLVAVQEHHKQLLTMTESKLIDAKEELLGLMDHMVQSIHEDLDPPTNLDELYSAEASSVHVVNAKWKSAPITALRRRKVDLKRQRDAAQLDMMLVEKYIRMMEYMFTGSLYLMVVGCVRHLSSELSNDANLGVICAAVTIAGDSLELSPSLKETQYVFHDSVARVIRLASNFHFSKNAMNWSSNRGTGALAAVANSFVSGAIKRQIKLQQLLRTDPTFSQVTKELDDELARWFHEAAQQMLAFESLRPIYAEVQSVRRRDPSKSESKAQSTTSNTPLLHPPAELTHLTGISAGDLIRYLKKLETRLTILDRSQHACQKLQSSWKVGFLEIQCRRSIADIMDLIAQERISLHETLYQLCVSGVAECVAALQSATFVFEDRPQLIEYFCEQMKQVRLLKDGEKQLSQDIRNIDDAVRTLKRFAPSLGSDVSPQYNVMHQLFGKYTVLHQAHTKFAAKVLPSITYQVNTALQKYSHRCQKLLRMYDDFAGMSAEADMEKNIGIFQEVARELTAIEKATKLYQEYQKMVGLKIVEIPLLAEAMSKWGEVQELVRFTIQWRTTINSMENGIFAEQNWGFHTEKVHSFLPVIRALQSRERAGFAEKMLESIHLAVVDYLRKLSLVREMAQPWVKAHHWKEILMLMDILNYVSSIGVLITDGATVTLGFLRSRDLWRFETQIRDITRKAHHDAVTENMLNAMKVRLQDAALPIIRSRDSYELDVPRANLLLESFEDDLLTIQSLAQVTASSTLQLQLVQWGEEVRHCEEVLDKWRAVQRDRTKLGSLFALRDVQQSVPDASFEFQAVDRKWKGMMHASKSASTLSICLREIVTMSFLLGAQDSYEKLWMHLGGYIEEKRRYFPRFNFVSDRDLFQLLVSARDPKNLPRMISKCFREIHSLRIPPAGSIIASASESEVCPSPVQDDTGGGVKLVRPEYAEHHEALLPLRTQHAVFDIDAIYGAPPGDCLAIKPLRVNASPEVWMKEFEERVQDAVANAVCSVMDGSLVSMFEDNFERLKRSRSAVTKQDVALSNSPGETEASIDNSVKPSQTGAWIEESDGRLWKGFPLQVILLCINILVTHDTSPLARMDRSGAGWQRFWEMFHQKKTNLITFIKRGDCSARERWIANSILTLLLNKSRGIRELYDDQPLAAFTQSAATSAVPVAGSDASVYHYSYAASDSFSWTKLPRFYYEPFEKKCTIHQCVKTFEYGYSFLGGYSCPVLSPICDRAVLAMSTALSLENGILLHSTSAKGSTGKRTLIRELAAMVGTECMAFDYSSGMTFTHMKRVLRGMLQCNTMWFSFSGLETSSTPHMLRVLAQEMHRVMDALRGRQDTVTLDGAAVEIVNTKLAVLVTCSLDYHFTPHQQLLLQLSSSFVPVSCTHADTELIMETLLFVNGFKDWKSLSQKLERLFSLLVDDPVPFTKDLLASRLPLVFSISRNMTKRLASETWESEERCLVVALWEETSSKIIPERRVAFLKCLRAVFPLAEDLEINSLGMLTLRTPMEASTNPRRSLKYDENGQVSSQDATEGAYDSDEEEQHSELKAVKVKLESMMVARQLCVSEFYTRKVLELYQVVSRRVVTVIAGCGVCGKSSALRIVSATLSTDVTYSEKTPSSTPTQPSSSVLDNRIKIVRLYPEAFQLCDIYGEFKDGGGWDDGFFSHFFRQNCTESSLNDMGVTLDSSTERSEAYDAGQNVPMARQESFYSKVQGASAVPPPSSTLHPASWMVFDGVRDVSTLLEPLRGLAEAVPTDVKRMVLPNGDQLHCSRERLRVFCEVESLQQWSPACLSRCGLVYMQADHILPYTLLIKSWSQQQQQRNDATPGLAQPLTTSIEVVNLVSKIMRSHLPALLDVCKRHSTGFIAFSVGHGVANMLQILTLFVAEISKGVEEESDDWMGEARVAVAYAATISLGMVLSARGRAEFHLTTTKIAPQLQDEHPLFVSGAAITLFDVGLRFQAHRIVLFRWTSVLSEGVRPSNHRNSFVYQTEVPRRTSALLRARGRLVPVDGDDDSDGEEGLFVGDTSSLTSALSTVYVPTPRTVSCRAWLKMLVSAKANAFVVGESGVGKTLVLENCLRELGQRERVSAMALQVSPSMAGRDIQCAIENGMTGKLKGAYCPGVGKRALVLLLENLNLETQEAKSKDARPCSAMIRQVTDGKGSFVKSSKEFVEFKDLSIWCSFSLSSFGYPRLSSRLLRHFHMMWLPDQCEQVFKQVLPTFSVHFMRRYESSFGNLGTVVKRVCQFPIQMFKASRKEWKSSLVSPHLLFNVGDVLSVFISLMNVSLTSLVADPGTEFERLTMFFTLQRLRNKLLQDFERAHLQSLAHDIATKLKFSLQSLASLSTPEEHLFADCGDTEGYTRVSSRSLMTFFVAGEERFHWYQKPTFRTSTAAPDHSPLSSLGSPCSRGSTTSGRDRRVSRPSLALSSTGSMSEDISVKTPSGQETIVRRSSLAMLALKSGATDDKVTVTSSTLQLQNMLEVYSFLQSGVRHLLVSGSDTADRRSTTMIACGAISFQFREVGAQVHPSEFMEQVKTIVMEAGLRATLTVLYVEYDYLDPAELAVLAHLIRQDDLAAHLYSSADKVTIHAFDHQSRGQPVVPSPASRSSFLHAVTTSSSEKGGPQSMTPFVSHQRSVYRENVRRSLYIVLSFGCAGKLFEFMTCFPSVYHRFVSKTFAPWQKGSAEAICNTSLQAWEPLDDMPVLQGAESAPGAISKANAYANDSHMRDQLRELMLVIYRTATELPNTPRYGAKDSLSSPSMRGRTYGAVSTRLEEILRVFKILFVFHSKKLEEQHRDLEKTLRFLKKKLSQTNLRVAREETSEVLQSDASQAVVSSGARLKDQETREREARRSFLLDEQCCAKMQNDIEVERATIQTELSKTLPDVQEATEALSQINKYHIVEMKSFINPPQLVRLVMQAVCVLLGVPPTWSEALRILADIRFLERLRDFDKDRIDPSLIERVKFYVNHPDFSMENMRRASLASTTLCKWVLALVRYFEAMKRVAPTQRQLEEAERNFRVVEERVLAEKKKLVTIEVTLNELRTLHSRNLQREENFQRTQEARLRWKAAITKFAGVVKHWHDITRERLECLEQRQTSLTGDCAILAMLIVLGAEKGHEERSAQTRQWHGAIHRHFRKLGHPSPFPVTSDVTTLLRHWPLSDGGLAPHLHQVITGMEDEEDEAFATSLFLMEQVRQVCFKIPLLLDPLGRSTAWIARAYKCVVNDENPSKPSSRNEGDRSTAGSGSGQRPQEGPGSVLVLDAGDPFLIHSIEKCIAQTPPSLVLVENAAEGDEATIEDALTLFTLLKKKSDCAVYFATKSLEKTETWKPKTWSHFGVVNFTPTPQDLDTQFLSLFCRQCASQTTLQRDIKLLKPKLREAQAQEETLLQAFIDSLCAASDEAAKVSRTTTPVAIAASVVSAWLSYGSGRQEFQDEDAMDRISAQLDEFLAVQTVREQLQQNLHRLHQERREALTFVRYARAFTTAEEAVVELEPLLSLTLPQIMLNVSECLEKSIASLSSATEDDGISKGAGLDHQVQQLPPVSSSLSALAAQVTELTSVHYLRQRLDGLPGALHQTYLLVSAFSLGRISEDSGESLESTRQVFTENLRARLLRVCSARSLSCQFFGWGDGMGESCRAQVIKQMAQGVVDQAVGLVLSLSSSTSGDYESGLNSLQSRRNLDDELLVALSKIQQAFVQTAAGGLMTSAHRAILQALYDDMVAHSHTWKMYLLSTLPGKNTVRNNKELSPGFITKEAVCRPPWVEQHFGLLEHLLVHICLFDWVSLRMLDDVIVSHFGEQLVSQVVGSTRATVSTLAKRGSPSTHVMLLSNPREYAVSASSSVRRCAQSNGLSGDAVTCVILGHSATHTFLAGGSGTSGDGDVATQLVQGIKDQADKPGWAIIEGAVSASPLNIPNALRHQLLLLQHPKTPTNQGFRVWLVEELSTVPGCKSSSRREITSIKPQTAQFPVQRVFLEPPQTLLQLYNSCTQDQADKEKQGRREDSQDSRLEAPPMTRRLSTGLMTSSFQHGGAEQRRVRAALWLFHSLFRLHVDDPRCDSREGSTNFLSAFPRDLCISHCEFERTTRLLQLHLHQRLIAATVTSGVSATSDQPVLPSAAAKEHSKTLAELTALIYMGRQWGDVRIDQCRDMLTWCFYPESLGLTTIEHDAPLKIRLLHLRDKLAASTMEADRSLGGQVELDVVPSSVRWRWHSNQASRVMKDLANIYRAPLLLPLGKYPSVSMDASALVACLCAAQRRLQELTAIFPGKSSLSSGVQQLKRQQRENMIVAWGSKRRTSSAATGLEVSETHETIRARLLPHRPLSSPQWQQQQPAAHLVRVELPAMEAYLTSVWKRVEAVLALRPDSTTLLEEETVATLKALGQDELPSTWRREVTDTELAENGDEYPTPSRLGHWLHWFQQAVAFYREVQQNAETTNAAVGSIVWMPAVHRPRALLLSFCHSVALAKGLPFKDVSLMVVAERVTSRTTSMNAPAEDLLSAIVLSGLFLLNAGWSLESHVLTENIESSSVRSDTRGSSVSPPSETFRPLPPLRVYATTRFRQAREDPMDLPGGSEEDARPSSESGNRQASATRGFYRCPLYASPDQLTALDDPLAYIHLPVQGSKGSDVMAVNGVALFVLEERRR